MSARPLLVCAVLAVLHPADTACAQFTDQRTYENTPVAISGTNVHGSIAGAGDSSYAVSTLLKGGPALGEAQFQHNTPRTTLGVSVAVTAPTGSYDSARLLNLGADR